MDVPDEKALEDHGDEDDDEDGEENWLIIEDCDGLGRRTNAGKPVELTHFWSLVIALLRVSAGIEGRCWSRLKAEFDQAKKMTVCAEAARMSRKDVSGLALQAVGEANGGIGRR